MLLAAYRERPQRCTDRRGHFQDIPRPIGVCRQRHVEALHDFVVAALRGPVLANIASVEAVDHGLNQCPLQAACHFRMGDYLRCLVGEQHGRPVQLPKRSYRRRWRGNQPVTGWWHQVVAGCGDPCRTQIFQRK